MLLVTLPLDEEVMWNCSLLLV